MAHRSHGFTLPELLAVLAILSVIAGLALPALGEALARHRLQATAEALREALGQARDTAVRRNHRTRVCASGNGHTCSPLGDWTLGWIGLDEKQQTVFESMGRLNGMLAATHRAGRQGIAFDESGTCAGQNQTITLCVRGRPGSAISIIVANSGRTRRQSATADDAAACAAMSSRKR